MAKGTLSIDENLLDILACPICHSNIKLSGTILQCADPKCARQFKIVKGVPQMNVGEVELDSAIPRIHSAQKLLQLSFRLAVVSAWSIPAMRDYSKQQCKEEIANGSSNALGHFSQGWNFEETLQEKIVKFTDQLVTPEELGVLFVLQWKDNLQKLAERNQKQQLEFKETQKVTSEFVPDNLDEREKIITESLPERGKLLYVGCGTGRECFRYEKMGYEVVGIDTEASLLQVMRDWSLLLNMRAQSVQMNVLFLGFLPHTFDAAILEIYSSFPSKAQRFKVQQELARVLKPGAFTIMVGLRFHYTKYMQLQNMWRDRPGSHIYLEKLANDLLQPSFKEPKREDDKDTNRLNYGAFRGSCTLESLSDELSCYFQVEKCWRAQDQRYLLALARPLPEEKWTIRKGDEPKVVKPNEAIISDADAFSKKLERFIGVLERNAEVTQNFIDQSVLLESKSWDMLRELLWKV